MTKFAQGNDGTRIAYEEAGSGAPILLVHGFASDHVQNWRAPGWYQILGDAGYRVLAMDCRGHGESDKPHDSAAYDHDIMASDAVAVMDAEGLGETIVMGYSMGGFLTMNLLMNHGARVTRAVIAGVGGSYLNPARAPEGVSDVQHRQVIADALLEPDRSKITDLSAKGFRDFADQGGKDRIALSACMRAIRHVYTPAELARADQPVLVVCGEKDSLTGPPDALAAAFRQGRAVTVPRRDHMTTVGDKVYKQAVLDFLAS